jgi:hypothetical protein
MIESRNLAGSKEEAKTVVQYLCRFRSYVDANVRVYILNSEWGIPHSLTPMGTTIALAKKGPNLIVAFNRDTEAFLGCRYVNIQGPQSFNIYPFKVEVPEQMVEETMEELEGVAQAH